MDAFISSNQDQDILEVLEVILLGDIAKFVNFDIEMPAFFLRPQEGLKFGDDDQIVEDVQSAPEIDGVCLHFCNVSS